MRHETRVIAAFAILTSSFIIPHSSFAYDDVTVCDKGGTNAPYTAASPLVCNNFTFKAGVANTTVELKPDSLASFTSGTHWIYGQLKMPWNYYKYSMTGELLITGKDTVVNANDVLMQNTWSTAGTVSTVDGEPFKAVMRIQDGAKLVVSNAFLMMPTIACDPYLHLDNATLEMLNRIKSIETNATSKAVTTNYYKFTMDRDNNATSYFHAVNSTIKSPKAEIILGHETEWGGGDGAQLVYCTNTTFEVAGLNLRYGTSYSEFVNCTFPTTCGLYIGAGLVSPTAASLVPTALFKDCTFDHVNCDIGWINRSVTDNRISHITFDGGTVNFDSLTLGRSRDGCGPGWLTFTNDVKITGLSGLIFGEGSTSRLDVVGTKLVTGDVYLGKNINNSNVHGCGIINIYDGSIVDLYWKVLGSGGALLSIGGNDPALVNVHGGALLASRINLPCSSYGTKDLSKGFFELHQTGGVVTNFIKGNKNYGTTIGTVASSHAKVFLDGGRFLSVKIEGSIGTSTLSANGGTLVPSVSKQTVSFISGVTHFTMGPKGLNFEVAEGIKDIFLDQASENQTDARGVFRKTGAGVLKLMTADADWTVAETVAAEGTLLVANPTLSYGVTTLVTTNTGILSVQGDSSTDGLLVGDLRLSGGAIALDDGEVVTVTNSFVATAATAIQFATTTALGAEVKAIVLAKGVTLSSETQAALRRLSPTGRTTAKGRPLVGRLDVRPGANDTQEIWYTVIMQPSGFAVMVK